MKRLLLLILAIPAVAAHAATQDAGTILQQIQPVAPQAPSPDSTGLTVEQPASANLPTSAPLPVIAIQISGNSSFPTPELHALIAGAEGKSLTLAQLNQFADRITNFYHQHGYFLARAYIPMQTIKNGIVRFEVLEALYDKVSLDNQSKVKEQLLADTLAPLKKGQPIEKAAIDRSLLLLSDIPGVKINATIKPGETVGTSDLNVEAKSSAYLDGNVALDNFGNRVTGHNRLGATLNYFNPLSHGDILSVSLLSSNKSMQYGRMSYETLVNGLGTRAGGAYSSIHYILGDTLANLGGHGTANVYNFWVKHPFVRSPNFNLYAQLQYDDKALDDRIDTASIRTQRRLENGIFSLSGDARYNFLSGSASIWKLDYTSGKVLFKDLAAQQADTLTANTAGAFSKWTLNFTQMQALTRSNTLYLNVSGQWTRSNLDSVEKMIAGGAYSVRAYDMGAASGDSGYSETIEFRHDFKGQTQAQWQAVAFVDSAQLVINHNPWTAATNTIRLSGAGIGLNWTGSNRLSAKFYVAKPIGPTSVLLPNTSSAKAWLVVSKGF